MVLDCAARYSEVSLNERLFSGPSVAQLRSVLLRFCLSSVSLSGKLKVMTGTFDIELKSSRTVRCMITTKSASQFLHHYPEWTKLLRGVALNGIDSIMLRLGSVRIEELHVSKITNWHPNVRFATHSGEKWESSLCQILFFFCHEQHPDDEKMPTLMVEFEWVTNNRPLELMYTDG